MSEDVKNLETEKVALPEIQPEQREERAEDSTKAEGGSLSDVVKATEEQPQSAAETKVDYAEPVFEQDEKALLREKRAAAMRKRYEEDPNWSVAARQKKKEAAQKEEPVYEEEEDEDDDRYYREERYGSRKLKVEKKEELSFGDKIALDLVEREVNDREVYVELKEKQSLAESNLRDIYLNAVIPDAVDEELQVRLKRGWGKSLMDLADESNMSVEEYKKSVRDYVVSAKEKDYTRDLSRIEAEFMYAKDRVNFWKEERKRQLQREAEEVSQKSEKAKTLSSSILKYVTTDLKDYYVGIGYRESEYADAYNQVRGDLVLNANTDPEKAKRLIKNAVNGILAPKRIEQQTDKVLSQNTVVQENKREDYQQTITPRISPRLEDVDPTHRRIR